MKINIQLDLRKKHPLGSDLENLMNLGKQRLALAKSLGPADPNRPGYQLYEKTWSDALGDFHTIRNALVAVADLIADDKVIDKCRCLRWAKHVKIPKFELPTK